LPELKWTKSSFSEASGNACVEIAASTAMTIVLRESEGPAHVITTDRATLRALIRGIQAGKFVTPRD
jgi:hypothetical protein